ncbi:MAG: TonB-dependent receptor [Gemmatimonadaceae bacterium]
MLVSLQCRLAGTGFLSVLLSVSVRASGAGASAHRPSPPTTAPVVRNVAGDSLRGVVTDDGGRGVRGATITLVELGRTEAADSNGHFLFTRVPAGRYTAIIRRIGYAPAVVWMTPGQPSVAVAIARSSFRLEPVTVTAARAAVSPLASSFSSAALSDERIRREHEVSLAHALEGIAGLRALSTGGQVAKPVVHGLTGPRVLVLDNGLRLEDYSWSDEDGPSIDARLAERVEVIRGPARFLYGSDAVAGVINAISADLPDGRGRMSSARVGGEVYTASNNREIGSIVRAEGANGPFGWRAVGIRRRAGNLRTPPGNDSTPTGELFNTGFRALNGELAAGLHDDRGSTTLRYARYGGDFGLLDGPPVPDDNVHGPLRRLADDRLQLSTTRIVSDSLLGGLRLESRTQWQRHWLREVADASRVGAATPNFDLHLSSYSTDVLLHHGSGDRNSGVFGVSGLFQTNSSRGVVPLVPDARTWGAATFAFETLSRGRWSALVGMRGDVRRLDADSNSALALGAQTRGAAALTAHAGTVFHPTRSVALAANLGRSFRAPTLFELFTNGPHLGEARFEIGLPKARPEASTTADLSVRWEGRSARAEVAGYRNRIDDYLYIAPTGLRRDSLPVYEYMQTNAVLIGADAAAEVALRPSIDVRLRFDIVRGRNNRTGEPLPRMPPPRGDVDVEVHGADRWSLTRLYIATGTEIVARQRWLGPFDTPTDAYAVVHLSGGVDRYIAGRLFALDVRVRNALNARHADFLSRYKSFAYAPGRNMVVRLSTGL